MNNFSASLDMYTDESKRKIKRRLSLDRSIEAISLTVKGYNKAVTKDSSCLQLRIGADMYELSTTEGVKEKKSWCAKLRQAINRGEKRKMYCVIYSYTRSVYLIHYNRGVKHNICI